MTPIHIAAEHGYIKIIKSLIGCSYNPNIPDNDGETPIHWAAKFGKTEIVKILLEYTDNPNAPANKGRTPIYHAAEFGYRGCVQTTWTEFRAILTPLPPYVDTFTK